MNPFDCLTVTLNPAIDRTLVISNFAVGQVNRVEGESLVPGGKGVNVAAALASEGHRVTATGFLGRDNPGLFEELFVRKSITDHFIRIDGATRVGLKITDPTENQTTDINFPGMGPTAGDLDQLQSVLRTLDADWVMLGGSLPPRVEPEFYRVAIESLKVRGCKVALDTSGIPLAHAIKARPDLIKPNIHELEALLNRTIRRPKEVLAAARELMEGGIELVVVSMGKEGALFVSKTDVIEAIPPRIQVRTTVGAGDAMVAGLISARLRGLPLPDLARLATAFSVRAISMGSDPMEMILPQVTIASVR